MKLIKRTSYLDRLRAVKGTPDIKIITGIRRSGKSKLLESFIAEIKETEHDANIMHINFNLTKYEDLTEYHSLEKYIQESYKSGVNNYVFIDEIQTCKGFERAINSLHASELFDLYVTGSNAFLLSSDLATLFTGRTYEIEVFPFSFYEYMDYYQPDDIQKSFDAYVREGGMAGSYLYETEKEKYSYIKSVFETLIIRDIKQKYKIRNVTMLDALADFLMDNVANISTARSIADALSKSQSKTNDKTIGLYISYLCNAFAFYKIRKYDIAGKRYLASQDKYYLSDASFRYARLGTKKMDYGRVYENIVAIELLRRGYELYAGFLYQKEIDFVAIKRNEKIYIQVSDDISDSDTFDREVTPLLKIKDAYPKVLIARTRHDLYTYEGIEIIDIATWLNNPISQK